MDVPFAAESRGPSLQDAQHRRPGDIHLHFFGTSKLSHKTRDWRFQAGDEIRIESPLFAAAWSIQSLPGLPSTADRSRSFRREQRDATCRDCRWRTGRSGLCCRPAQRGVSVTVLESRPRLGGRASSFLDRATETKIDNCQHVSLGCCTNFRHFCRTAGLADLFRTEPELFFIGSDNVVNPLASGRLPAPFHCVASFGRMSYLSRNDRLCIALGLRRLAAGRGGEAQALSDWLRNQRQTETAIDRFWNPVLVSALSETLDRIDVAAPGRFSSTRFWRIVKAGRCRFQPCRWTHCTANGCRDGFGCTARRCGCRRASNGSWLKTAAPPGPCSARVKGSRRTTSLSPSHIGLSSISCRTRARRTPPCRRSASWSRPRFRACISGSTAQFFFPRISGATRADATGSARELPHAVLIGRLSQWVFNRSLLHAANGNVSPDRREIRLRNLCSPVTAIRSSSAQAATSPTIVSARDHFQGGRGTGRNLSRLARHAFTQPVGDRAQGCFFRPPGRSRSAGRFSSLP